MKDSERILAVLKELGVWVKRETICVFANGLYPQKVKLTVQDVSTHLENLHEDGMADCQLQDQRYGKLNIPTGFWRLAQPGG